MPRTVRLWMLVAWAAWLFSADGLSETLSQRAQQVLDKTSTRRGICVVAGENSADLALELARRTEWVLYVQASTFEEYGAAARAADETGLLGKRVFVGYGSSARWNLADNLADLVVLSADESSGPAADEAWRILRPGGKALTGTKELPKPFPEGTDDWSHPYHGPDNNPQSRDRVAQAPYLTHFLAEPWYSPMPLVTVASGGRLFKAFGHVAIKQREWPLLNTLVAQNAFNGTLLWQRPLSGNFMIHRNTLIATPHTLLLADDVSCKLLDAETGELRAEIVTTPDDGVVWKWMALVGKTLYALVGDAEAPDPTVRGDRRARGWPWGPPLGRGYNNKEYPWGFGRTLLAVDVESKKVLWRHQEEDPIDARAMSMAHGRIFFYCHPTCLGAVDAASGSVLWRNTDAELMRAIGPHLFAQNPKEGFSTSNYVKCNDRAVYFAGPIRSDLVAVSAENGKLLWRQENGGNSQLVLRDDGLYAMGPGQSARFDFLTGNVLESLGPRVNCTRATGSADSIFVRGGRDGTMRYDLASRRQQHLCPMRPSCQDGVLVAHGHLFWGPWMCDCNLTLVGVVSLAPAGSFDFAGQSPVLERTEPRVPRSDEVSLDVTAADWPTLRANNARTATTAAVIPAAVELKWRYSPPAKLAATAPTAAGGLVFSSGRDGAVRALDGRSGSVKWSFYTGGAVTYPPSIWQGRAYVGSGDGWVYCLAADSGRLQWRFRAAPAERLIPVYGSLRSTWPVASGVLVNEGVAFAAAGMANYDGTHVFALDAVTGNVRWHNHSSGNVQPETSGGVSVNGHLLLHGQHVYLAGGNMVPIAAYNVADGACLTGTTAPPSHTQFTAGSDLFVAGKGVQVGGAPLYSPPGDYRMVNRGLLQTPLGDLLLAYGPHDGSMTMLPAGAGDQKDAQPVWRQQPLNRICGVVAAANAILLAGAVDSATPDGAAQAQLVALNAVDGRVLWSHALPALPVPWGICVDRDGQIVVTLDDGSTLCFAGA